MKACRRARTSVELAEYVQGIELTEIGGYKVSVRPCGDTVSAVYYEYEAVKPQREQICNIASQMKVHGDVYSPGEIRRDFAGQRVLAFAYHSDLREAADPEGNSAAGRVSRSVSFLAAEMIGRVIKRTPETVLQYVKLSRSRQNKHRQVQPPRP